MTIDWKDKSQRSPLNQMDISSIGGRSGMYTGTSVVNGRKFLSHQFTFLESPIFLDLKMNLPITSLKPVSWSTNVFQPSLEPPNRGKTTSLAVKFLRRAHPCFRICKLWGERESRVGESSQNRVRTGSTCLSVAKVPPDYVVYIPPILGGHPVTASAAKPFFPERKSSECERENGHSPRDDHTETKVSTYETECVTDPVRCLLTVHRMSNEQGRKHLASSRSPQTLHLARHVS